MKRHSPGGRARRRHGAAAAGRRERRTRASTRILTEYHELTGIPSVINTSFNMHEEPIVCSPDDAIRAFLQGNLDYLAIGDYLARQRLARRRRRRRGEPGPAQARRRRDRKAVEHHHLEPERGEERDDPPEPPARRAVVELHRVATGPQPHAAEEVVDALDGDLVPVDARTPARIRHIRRRAARARRRGDDGDVLGPVGHELRDAAEQEEPAGPPAGIPGMRRWVTAVRWGLKAGAKTPFNAASSPERTHWRSTTKVRGTANLFRVDRRVRSVVGERHPGYRRSLVRVLGAVGDTEEAQSAQPLAQPSLIARVDREGAAAAAAAAARPGSRPPGARCATRTRRSGARSGSPSPR